MAIEARRGQALMELATGMFALALVVSMLCGFAVYIAKSLKLQNSVRVGSASTTETVEVSDFAAEYVFGTDTLKISEKVVMPTRTILE